MSDTVWDSRTGELLCLNCGAREPGPVMPIGVGKFCKAVKGFDQSHAGCQPKALSLRQPWAWLMLRPDLISYAERLAAAERGHIKDIENRNWNTHFRGRVLVHASGTMTRGDYEAAQIVAASVDLDIPPFHSLQRGGIVGEFRIADVVTESASPWFFGKYGFVVTDARPLAFRPCKASQRWFTPDYGKEVA